MFWRALILITSISQMASANCGFSGNSPFVGPVEVRNQINLECTNPNNKKVEDIYWVQLNDVEINQRPISINGHMIKASKDKVMDTQSLMPYEILASKDFQTFYYEGHSEVIAYLNKLREQSDKLPLENRLLLFNRINNLFRSQLLDKSWEKFLSNVGHVLGFSKIDFKENGKTIIEVSNKENNVESFIMNNTFIISNRNVEALSEKQMNSAFSRLRETQPILTNGDFSFSVDDFPAVLTRKYFEQSVHLEKLIKKQTPPKLDLQMHTENGPSAFDIIKGGTIKTDQAEIQFKPIKLNGENLESKIIGHFHSTCKQAKIGAESAISTAIRTAEMKSNASADIILDSRNLCEDEQGPVYVSYQGQWKYVDSINNMNINTVQRIKLALTPNKQIEYYALVQHENTLIASGSGVSLGPKEPSAIGAGVDYQVGNTKRNIIIGAEARFGDATSAPVLSGNSSTVIPTVATSTVAGASGWIFIVVNGF